MPNLGSGMGSGGWTHPTINGWHTPSASRGRPPGLREPGSRRASIHTSMRTRLCQSHAEGRLLPPRCPHFAALHGALRLGAIDLAQPQLDLDEPRSEHRIECRSRQPRSLLLGTWLGSVVRVRVRVRVGVGVRVGVRVRVRASSSAPPSCATIASMTTSSVCSASSIAPRPLAPSRASKAKSASECRRLSASCLGVG